MATTSLLTTLDLVLKTEFDSAMDLSTAADTTNLTVQDTLQDGTAANKADLVWHDRRTLDSTSEDLDLAGSLTDAFGNTVTFANIRAIAIKNRETDTGYDLAVGGAASNQFVNWVADSSDIVNIGPDGVFLLYSPVDGYDVTADTGDTLKIDAGSNSVTYDIVVIGTTA